MQVIQQESITTASADLERVPVHLGLLRSFLVIEHIVTNDSKGHGFFLST
jgi:hypothetical protein